MDLYGFVKGSLVLGRRNEVPYQRDFKPKLRHGSREVFSQPGPGYLEKMVS